MSVARGLRTTRVPLWFSVVMLSEEESTRRRGGAKNAEEEF